MNNSLIVATFDREGEASIVLEQLKSRRDLKILGLENAVVVVKDSAGQIAAYQQWKLPATPISPGSQISRRFAEALFGGNPKIKRSQLSTAGFDETFLEELAESLHPADSALVIFIPAGNLVDKRLILDSLGQSDGVLHHTIFPIQVLETIEELVKSYQYGGEKY